MKELSVFTDESGDFGEARERPAYYLVTFVFHDQADEIDRQVEKLEKSIKDAGYEVEYIHTGPVIRREEVFERYFQNSFQRLNSEKQSHRDTDYCRQLILYAQWNYSG